MSIRKLFLLSGNAPFKRVKSISLGLGRQAYAILINSRLACSTKDFLACGHWMRGFSCEKQRRRSEIIFRGDKKGGNPRLERASTLSKYACETIRLACHAVHRSRVSWGKKINVMYTRVMRNKERGRWRRETLYKRAREIPPTPLVFPPFPIIPSELQRVEYESARSLASAKPAGHQNCIWLTVASNVARNISLYFSDL